MATYKKRGYKPKEKVEKIEQLEGESTTAGVFRSLDEGASKTEIWIASNQNYIYIAIGVIAVTVLGFIAYTKFIAEPTEKMAMNDMYHAQKYFDEAIQGSTTEKDSLFNLSLNGGEGKFGFLDIVDQYSGTAAGNLSKYYAGMAYLNLRDYKNAIDYLSKYSSSDLVTEGVAKGAIGDAFMQLEQKSEALNYYEEAVRLAVDEFTVPIYLMKAGSTALDLNEYERALKYFERIKSDYPKSQEATNIEVYIGRTEALLN